MSENLKLSIVIPVYNEEKFILEVLNRIENLDCGLEKEIVIVDDASADNTKNILKSTDKYKIFYHEKNQGKGQAILTAAKYAKENGFNEFSSVLGISRYKNLESVNAAAEIAQKEFDIAYNFTNWRKNSGEQEGIKTVKQLNLYIQNYCGCEFSKR